MSRYAYHDLVRIVRFIEDSGELLCELAVDEALDVYRARLHGPDCPASLVPPGICTCLQSQLRKALEELGQSLR